MSYDRLVMIPGPTPVVKSIQDQMAREIQAFGDPRFVADYKGLIADLGMLFNCNGKVFPLAGTGTLAMEMAIANTTKRGDNVLIVSHGFFGDRFIDLCTRKGLNVDVMSAEWGQIIPVADIEKKLSEKQYAVITVSHVDTSTGVLAPVKEIGDMLQKFPDTLYIVDGVAASGGEYTDCTDMHIDVLFTASQKAFGVCPGMFILWVSDRALARRKTLGVIPEFYIDFDRWLPIIDDPGKYFATPAINLVWALCESVRIMKAEGMLARFQRHFKHARAMQAAFEALGFRVLADKNHRASTLSNLVYPDGLDDVQFRSAMMSNGVIVAGGLAAYAGRMCRIGHMGNADQHDFLATIGALECALNACGKQVAYGTGTGAYLAELAKA